jgi:beta-mannosidase
MEAVTLPADRFPQSAVMEHHNKQIEGTERLIRFQSAHHTVTTDFDEFIYKTQLVQAEALKCAVEHWRRQKFHTAGALFWQLNDCWPVSSWSVIDSALRPKAAYYYARKFYAPLLVSFARRGDDLEVWLTNDFLEGFRGELSVTLRSFAGKRRWHAVKRVAVPANRSLRVMTLPHLPDVRPQEHYFHAQVKVGHHEVSENRFFFDEPKRLNLPETKISVKLNSSPSGAHLLMLRASRFVKNVRIEFEGMDIHLDDNYVDIDAGQERIIPIRSSVPPARLKKALRLRWLELQPARSGRG